MTGIFTAAWCLVTTKTSYPYNIIIYHRKLYYDCVCIIILKNVFYQPLSDNSWDVTESTESPPISKRSAADYYYYYTTSSIL